MYKIIREKGLDMYEIGKRWIAGECFSSGSSIELICEYDGLKPIGEWIIVIYENGGEFRRMGRCFKEKDIERMRGIIRVLRFLLRDEKIKVKCKENSFKFELNKIDLSREEIDCIRKLNSYLENGKCMNEDSPF